MGQYVTVTSDKKRATAALLCAIGFLGVGGLHYFYVGRVGMGLLYLFTGGLFGLGTVFGIFSICLGSFRDNTGTPLRR